MGESMVKGKLGWITIGLVFVLCLGCKPGRPQFALPKIKMVTGENLHGVVPLTAEEVLLFGNYGVIYHNGTGGNDIEDWKPQESGLEDSLLCEAAFIDKNRGWIVGTKGTIIHTIDSGKKWIKQESGTEKNLFSVSFVDAQNGWVVGEFGTIIHTPDGGESWVFQSKDIDKMLNGVCFIDNQNGWVVGEFGTILHTADGGKLWEEQRCEDIESKVGMDSYDWKPMPALYEVHFEDKHRGWIVGMDGIILKTEDGGDKWRRLKTNCEIPLYSIEIRGNRGWVVGSRGYYLLSHDGGETWIVKDGLIKTRFWLRDIAFSDGKNGWIVGAMGTIARTTDGGRSWELISGMSYDMPEYGLADFE
jgi:photosystem II stability/assembly factor-like uncharacterized protein